MKWIAGEIKVYLDPSVNEMLEHWVEMAKGEISGLGLVERTEHGFLVTEVFLPEQTCTGASATMEFESVAKLMLELEDAGYDTGKLKFFWHSHANMDVFWSNTDEETIKTIHSEDFFLSLVLNKKGASKARVDLFKPLKLTFDEVPLAIHIPSLGLKATCQKLFKERVRENNPLLDRTMNMELVPGYQREPWEEDDFMGLTEEEWGDILERRAQNGLPPPDRDF